MAKNRIVNTRFWIDDYISHLDPIEKLMFLYFLTNPLTDISGIYEIPLKNVALDTGIDKEMAERIIKRFERDGKIFYENGWVAVKNFSKHQVENPKVLRGIELGIEKAPKSLVNKVQNSLSSSIDSLSHSNSKFNSNSNFNFNSAKAEGIPDTTKESVETIFSWYKEKVAKNSRLTDSAKDKIKSRLKVWSEDDLVKAIVNFSKDSWWMENNSSRGIAWFFHTDDRIDGFVNMKPKEGGNKGFTPYLEKNEDGSDKNDYNKGMIIAGKK